MEKEELVQFTTNILLISIIIGVGVLLLDTIGNSDAVDVSIAVSEGLTWPSNASNVSLTYGNVSSLSITNSSGSVVPADQYVLFSEAGVVENVYVCTSVNTSSRGQIFSPSSAGANSDTYNGNYEEMVADGLDTKFNVTITASSGGLTYLLVPEFTSATACGIAQLQTTYNTSIVNFSNFEVRSDAFSETGVVLAGSNQPNAFHGWYTTLSVMDQCGYGVLPCWVNIWNGTHLRAVSTQNDTAIDGSLRSAIALFIAADNGNFTAANRTLYRALGEQILIDSYAYESIAITSKATRAGTNVTRLPMGGGDCAASGIGCSTDQWIGYGGDIVLAYEHGYAATGNATYRAIAQNFTLAFLSISIQNDTDGDGFGVAPFNFNWNTAGTYLGHLGGGGVNSYHYDAANSQWDDSDAPRFENFCDTLRIANASGPISGPYENLTTYCTAWKNSLTFTNTTSCLQYFYNGTCSTSIRSGYYENGLGTFTSTYVNTTFVKPKVDEVLTHYGWSGGTFDGSSCGTGLSFRGAKATKALMAGIGKDMPLITNVSVCEVPAVCAVGATCTAAYAYDGEGVPQETFFAARDALGELATSWFGLIVLIGALSVILVMVIRSFSGASR